MAACLQPRQDMGRDFGRATGRVVLSIRRTGALVPGVENMGIPPKNRLTAFLAENLPFHSVDGKGCKNWEFYLANDMSSSIVPFTLDSVVKL